MPNIRSANPDFPRLEQPGPAIYRHGLDRRESFIPMAFQVMSPVNDRTALLPHALVLHVNPQNLSASYTKKVERIQTKGGWVEQHWPDELDEFSADQVTGSFMNIQTGLSSLVRQRTIAWSRFRDLYDLYRHNGSVYDNDGTVVLQGQILLMFDRGSYYGTFRNFKIDETADNPFMFKLSWTFKVEQTVISVPRYQTQNRVPAPIFQTQNAKPVPPLKIDNPPAASELTAVQSATVRAERNRE